MASEDRDERTKLNSPEPASRVEAGPGFLYDTVIQVFVGPHEKQFNVHKKVLCSVSDFFSAALDEEFKEAGAGAVKLPEQDPDTFQYFVHWLYKEKLTGYFRPGISLSIDELYAAEKATRKINEGTKFQEDWAAILDLSDAQYLALFEDAPIPELISLHILADALQVRGLKDHIVNVIVKVYATEVYRANEFWHRDVSDDRLQPLLIMNDAFERARSTSTLRRFIIELCLYSIPPQVISLRRDLLSFDFVCDWLVTLQKLGMYGLPADDFRRGSIICKYHEHDAKCLLETKDIMTSTISEW